MSGTIHVVKTSEEFYKAVQEATGGDRIELAPGDYGDISLRNTSFDEKIVITSQDPENLATFNTMKLSGLSNITFDNLFFDFTPDEETVKWDSAFRADNSSGISIINSRFESGPAVAGIPIDSDPGTQGAEGIQGLPIARAITFNWSENIVIENNEVSGFRSGVIFGKVDNITFNSNEIHDFRGVPVAGADVSNLSMENNYFHDANPWKFGGLGDHGDFVHFWTSGPDAVVSENHYYANNIFDQGDGVAILGIYLDDNSNEVGFKNVTIENNLIYNGNAQALRMENVDGLNVRDNTILQSSGDGKDAPMVRLTQGSKNVVIEGNILGGVVGPDLENAESNNITIRDNLVVQIHDPQGENYYGDLFVTSAASVFDIRAVPGDVADGIGSSFTQFDWSPDTLSPQFQVSSDASSAQTLVFDASLTVGPLGLVTEEDAQFIWTFGDGTTATGQIVAHDFANAGHYNVALQVVAKDGTTSAAGFTASVAGADILAFDAASGQFEALAFGEERSLDAGTLPLISIGDDLALKLGGTGRQASINAADLSRFFGTDDFELSMTLKASHADSWGEIARIHGSFITGVDKNGNFSLNLFPDDGSRLGLKSSGIDVTDGNSHDIMVRFDGEAGFVEILIDGKVVASQDVTGSLAGGPRSLDFGNPWGATNFDGELSAFSLQASAFDFPLYDASSEGLDREATLIEEDISQPALPAPVEDAAPAETVETSPTDTTEESNPGEAATPSDPPQSDPAEPVDAPAPEDDSGLISPLLRGGYQFDVATAASTEGVEFHDDAHVVEDAEGIAVTFDGQKDYVSLGRLTEFEDSQKIAFEVDFTSDSIKGGAERLVWNHMKVGLTLEADGIRVHAANEDDRFSSGFKISGLDLHDGNRHDVAVMVDAETDRLQVVVDDVLMLDEQGTDFNFVGAGGHEWGWSLGTAWNRWFDGEVYDFQVSNDFDFVDHAPVDEPLLST